jgi:hypothetical protein
MADSPGRAGVRHDRRSLRAVFSRRRDRDGKNSVYPMNVGLYRWARDQSVELTKEARVDLWRSYSKPALRLAPQLAAMQSPTVKTIP